MLQDFHTIIDGVALCNAAEVYAYPGPHKFNGRMLPVNLDVAVINCGQHPLKLLVAGFFTAAVVIVLPCTGIGNIECPCCKNGIIQ